MLTVLGAAAPLAPLDVVEDVHVEVGHQEQRHKELQGGCTQEEEPVAEELGIALVRWYHAVSSHVLPEEDCWAVEEEGKDPDGHHLDDRVGRYSLPGSVRYL